MITTITKTVGGREVTIETGKLAAQSSGAVTVRCGDTIVLVTAVGSKEPKPNAGFFPLTVAYIEKTYAAGKIPGGFFKREGRPTDKETLTSRFIDRPVRPLFPDGYMNETQVIATVLSTDIDNEANLLAMTGASAALCISPIPFNGPIAGARVGRIEGKLKLNPTPSEMAGSDIDVIVAASRSSVVMVEGGAKIVDEKDILDAIAFAHKEMQPLFDLQDELVKKCGKEKWEVKIPEVNAELVEKVKAAALDKIKEALTIKEKLPRYDRFDEIKAEVIAALTTEENCCELAPEIKEILGDLKKTTARSMLLETGKRIDGRGNTEIRPITCEVGLLPRVHGSALFTRGETQAIAAVTLGTAEDSQRIDSLEGESRKSFMLHYNFPPYCVGEAKPMRGTSRREIGHGALAERAFLEVLPVGGESPYTIRLVSEVLTSNGSSSMATVCGGSLALMNAGIAIKEQVAGIAMGLIKEGDKYSILSDILGDEDHLGDMDFKVTGTKDGVTALQMDIKIDGLSQELLTEALNQAKAGRLHILGKMNECIATPNKEVSKFAPKILGMKIDPKRIGEIIGSGGKTINKIIDATGAKMNVDDEGNIQVASIDADSAKKALSMAKSILARPKTGKYYKGKVVKIMEFGAFVKILPNADGLVHVSELDTKRVDKVTDIVKEGDELIVKVLDVDTKTFKVKLSRKAALDYKGEVEDVTLF